MRAKRLPEAAATVRQRIADALRAGPATAKDLSKQVGVSEREVAGHLDGADAFPLDPTQWQMPAPNPAETTPPVIMLLEPAGAVVLP